MIKVCHMTNVHGAEDVRIFHKECVSLAKAGYDVYLVERGESYEKNGVHIVGVGEIPAGRIKRMTKGAKTVYQKALEIDADIYHFHDPELLPYGLKLKSKGKKVIFDSHECYTLQIRIKPYLPAFAASLVSALYEFYERYALKKIDAVIFPATINGVNPFEGLCRRSCIISNAVILEEFDGYYKPDTIKKENQICCVGGLTEARGITVDILAAKKANATLALAGTFSPSAYGDAVRDMAEYDCVDYRGRLNRNEVAALLAESQIGMAVYLRRGQYGKTDAFAVKMYEYMAMGLPIIFNKSDKPSPLLKPVPMGIAVDENNIDEVADAIRYLLDHPDEARRMGENGRRAVQEKWNWSVEEKKLLELYQDILKE